MAPESPNDIDRSVTGAGAEPDDRDTSLPLLYTWRLVYLFVVGTFVIWVVLLTALERMFR